jgi:hypothetical protein
MRSHMVAGVISADETLLLTAAIPRELFTVR